MTKRLKIIKELDSAPYYICDIGEGKFQIVTSLIENSKFNCDYHFNFGRILSLGLDIKETPSRNLQLFIDISENEDYFLSYINECRKLASISGHDYVSVERFGGNIPMREIGKTGEVRQYIIRPRLFRKIQLDDRI